MALTMLPPSARPGRGLRSVLATPVWREEGARAVVLIGGEADVSVCSALYEVLARVINSSTGDVVIDLAEATFIDTAAVRVLANGQRMLDRCGRKLTFRSPSPPAERVLELFGLADCIEQPRRSQR
jgi:anti-sigma B factor antagonist